MAIIVKNEKNGNNNFFVHLFQMRKKSSITDEIHFEENLNSVKLSKYNSCDTFNNQNETDENIFAEIEM